AGIIGIVDVAVALPVECVRLVKGDFMPALRKRGKDAPVIGGRPVPVGRDKAGAEKADFHIASSFCRSFSCESGIAGSSSLPSIAERMPRSSLTRQSQLWRSRMA